MDDGIIVVDAHLRTSHPDIYAAGDVAAFYNPALGKRMRVEHEDNANAMGRLAGRNMAGKSEPYHHLPFFYSDMFELGYEAVGEVDSRLETFADWKRPNEEGVVYYLKDGRVRGVLLWNVWDQVESRAPTDCGPRAIPAEILTGRQPAKPLPGKPRHCAGMAHQPVVKYAAFLNRLTSSQPNVFVRRGDGREPKKQKQKKQTKAWKSLIAVRISIHAVALTLPLQCCSEDRGRACMNDMAASSPSPGR